MGACHFQGATKPKRACIIVFWKPCHSVAFSPKSFLRELDAVPGGHFFSLVLCWVWLPLESMFSVGLQVASSRMVSMIETLRRRGLLSEDILHFCLLCAVERETVDHLILHCAFSFSLC